MSLPANVKVSVQGHSRPGDPLHSIPKQAMIVRMSAETLDALQSTPHMEFTFGPESGIKIGDAFFPMRALKENAPHDLYLRASSAAKPLAPLKLHANITGKYTVERDLGKVQDDIRSARSGAEKSRKERTTVMLDTPPPDLSSSAQTSKRRKTPAAANSLFRRPVSQPRPLASTRAPSPLPPVSPSPERTAVIKALAVKERSFDELLSLMPGEDDGQKRKRNLMQLLNQLAEQPNPAKSPSRWRLKPASWVEVRPYEWSDLTEQERTAVARTARLTFSNLNISQSDPLWEHVVYRKNAESSLVTSAASSSNASPTVKTEVQKRGVSSKEAKEKKMKHKVDPKAEILMRDESKPVASASSATTRKETDDSSATAQRKLPGSGFRLSRASSGDSQNPSLSNTVVRGKPVDVRTNREPPRASLPARAAPPIPPPLQEKKAAPPRIKKKETGPEGGREQGVEFDGKEPLKRKKPLQDIDGSDSTSVGKRRKTDGLVPIPTPRDLTLPKKPEATKSRPLQAKGNKADISDEPPLRPSQKSRNDDSSLPARPVTGSGSSSKQVHLESHSNAKNSNQAHRSSTSGSRRRERRSPIYTSSEDEEGQTSPSVRKDPAPLPTPPATTAHSLNRSRGQQLSASSRPLPTDRDGLRARYNATYRKYLSSYQQLFAQQCKLESLLNGRDESSISDSEGDVEVLSPEETLKLKADYKRWEKELQNIRNLFAPTETSGLRSEEQVAR